MEALAVFGGVDPLAGGSLTGDDLALGEEAVALPFELATTVVVAQAWMSVADEGLGVDSSSRQAACRPFRLQTRIRPLFPIPDQTSISPASRSRRSLAAVTALAVPAHIATASLGTTP